MRVTVSKYKKSWEPLMISATGVVCGEPCFYGGFFVGPDANDPEVIVYNNASAASGTEVPPGNDFDASQLGLNGFVLKFPGIEMSNGIYCTITTAGTCDVTFLFRKWSEL